MPSRNMRLPTDRENVGHRRACVSSRRAPRFFVTKDFLFYPWSDLAEKIFGGGEFMPRHISLHTRACMTRLGAEQLAARLDRYLFLLELHPLLSQGSWLDAVVAGAVEQVIYLCGIRLALGFHLLELILRISRRAVVGMIRSRLVVHIFAVEEGLCFFNLAVQFLDFRAQGRQLPAIPRRIFLHRIPLRFRARVLRGTIANHRDAWIVAQGVDLVVGPDLGRFCIV